ncbi:STAS domain-containing protein [Streptomyces sp. cg35]|uniref:STAS domain-containing protein n=1 Tax=Streptomyces sp. cg35 TaxID=3421650 RepID=UPI003D16C73E
MDPDRQNIDVTHQERVAVVSFRNDLDLTDEAEAALALNTARTDTSSVGTVVDLADLDFADSSLLNLILREHAAHQSVLRPFVLAGPYHSGIQRLLEITGVNDVLVLTGTRSDGIRHVHELRGRSTA